MSVHKWPLSQWSPDGSQASGGTQARGVEAMSMLRGAYRSYLIRRVSARNRYHKFSWTTEFCEMGREEELSAVVDFLRAQSSLACLTARGRDGELIDELVQRLERGEHRR